MFGRQIVRTFGPLCSSSFVCADCGSACLAGFENFARSSKIADAGLTPTQDFGMHLQITPADYSCIFRLCRFKDLWDFEFQAWNFEICSLLMTHKNGAAENGPNVKR